MNDYNIKEKENPLLPRERLAAFGAKTLADQELLAILLRTGSEGVPVMELSKRIIEKFHNNLADFRMASLEELQEIPGIGKVKAVEIQAMIELGKRIQSASREILGEIRGSEQFGAIMVKEMADLNQENLVAIYLDPRNQIIKKQTIFVGSINSSTACPREVLYYAIKYLASSLIIVHNHPSGNPKPSENDIKLTRQLRSSCTDVGISLMDHVIVGQGVYYSFQEKGLL